MMSNAREIPKNPARSVRRNTEIKVSSTRGQTARWLSPSGQWSMQCGQHSIEIKLQK